MKRKKIKLNIKKKAFKYSKECAKRFGWPHKKYLSKCIEIDFKEEK